MGILAQYDIGIGTIPTSAYVRISKIEYSEATYTNELNETVKMPEWQYEISTYYNKECRNLEIIKEYMEKDFMLTTQYINLSQTVKDWINMNIVSRVARPLQIIAFGTVHVTPDYPSPTSDSTTQYNFFYTKLKDQYGPHFQNPTDEVSTSQHVISDFKLQHPEIFGGI